ncbi:bacteriocin-like protein [Chryseobacterium antibioticum]
MKNLKKLTKTDLKSVYGGEPKKYCVYCERINYPGAEPRSIKSQKV